MNKQQKPYKIVRRSTERNVLMKPFCVEMDVSERERFRRWKYDVIKDGAVRFRQIGGYSWAAFDKDDLQIDVFIYNKEFMINRDYICLLKRPLERVELKDNEDGYNDNNKPDVNNEELGVDNN